ncbi:biotin-acetyl-CoA-carboxylase ligase [Comamonas testosteroni TK102]|uniref:biotin--[biotin carboxyl-carrier protein] ligase n=1 Tax=Comamonas testosteroni TK102 TaxID=1392005 RepID=A0A076PVM2_COMTE|nr:MULTISPECIES: biotin--[acetyl-CoA-carboxylase] ligase [Comamonas]AIJ49733.1 biotin-acetyl-CoA-carboxylase ligase [Comamonas testosteroni TK102]MPS90026.1 biotin--[acetyl-CoA-carboxylase] ligase [Comamonas sp.]
MTQPIHWNAEALWEAIAPQLPGFTVEVLPTIGSSNTELMRRARDGLTEPVLLIAEQQTQGRGRLGRNWVSGVGDSLMFSLGLPLAPRDWSGLSLAVGVSVAESLQPHLPVAGSATPRIGIKWPNDLWLEGDRKLAGILIETASFVGTQQHDMTAPRYVVIGIGINVRPRPGDGMRTAPACLQELDAALDAPTALACILPNLVAEVQSFARHGFVPLMQRFAQRDLLAGREVSLSDGTSGIAQGVAADGGFLVRTAAGLQAVTSSEISVRPASSPLQA